MRATLTIDPDVAQLLAQTLERAKKPFKQVINDASRRGLSAPASVPASVPGKPFKVEPHAMGWNAGLDPAGFNQLIDQLAVDDYLEVQQRQGLATVGLNIASSTRVGASRRLTSSAKSKP